MEEERGQKVYMRSRLEIAQLSVNKRRGFGHSGRSARAERFQIKSMRGYNP